MAINPNDDLENKHMAFLATSGGGKTYKVKKLLESRKNARVMVFDMAEMYLGIVEKYFDDIDLLIKQVRADLVESKIFRYGYSGNEADYNKFARLCWVVGDGNIPLVMVNEECGSYLNNGVSTSGWWFKCMTVGRKYAIQFIAVTQRPQNVSKVIYDLVDTVWIGNSNRRAKSYLEKEFEINLDLIKAKSYGYFLSDSDGMRLMDKNDKMLKIPK